MSDSAQRTIPRLAVALTMLAAAFAPATAQATERPRVATKLSLSAPTMTRGGATVRATVRVVVPRTLRRCSVGRVRVFVDGRRIAERPVRAVRLDRSRRVARTSVAMPASLSAGRHVVGARFLPTAGCSKVWAPAQVLRVTEWVRVVGESFGGTELARRWSPYTGHPTSDPWMRWSADRVAVRDGSLRLTAAPRSDDPRHWTAGAVALGNHAQTYGRYVIRFRAHRSSIQSLHFLLWPSPDAWPPEIDIAEMWDHQRRELFGFLHYRDSEGRHARHMHRTTSDFTRWNTVELRWRPGRLDYLLNGRVWRTITGRSVPRQPMFLALQTETQSCDRQSQDCTAERLDRPLVEVASVVVEKYRP